MAASPLLPIWRRLNAVDRRIRGPEPSLTVLHLQPGNGATPILLARIREDALRSGWTEQTARILAAPPSLVEDEDAAHEAMKMAALARGTLAPGWGRLLAGVQHGAAWAVLETSHAAAFVMAWLGQPEALGVVSDAGLLQEALRALPLPPHPRLLLLPPPGASAHDRLQAASLLGAVGPAGARLSALLPKGTGGMEIRQAPGLRAIVLLDRQGRPTSPLLLADVPTSCSS
jgi:hypothetical protein